MTQYRKKPVAIEAFLLPPLDENADAFMEWAALVEFDGYTSEREGCMAIETLEGTMTAEPGDWIIKGIKGEFYPCKPDIFAVTYEAADAPQAVCNMGTVPLPAPDTTFYAAFEGDKVKYHSVDQLCEYANARVAAALAAQQSGPAGALDDGDAEARTSRGRFLRIDALITELNDIRRKFGNTCIYVRDAAWGATALNRLDEDRKADIDALQA